MFLAVQVCLVIAGLVVLFRGRFDFGDRVVGNPMASLIGLVLVVQLPLALVLWMMLWIGEPPAAATTVIPTRAGEAAPTVTVTTLKGLANEYWWVDPFVTCGAVIIAAVLTGIALRNENASDEVFETLGLTEPEGDAAP
jgi:hypothetical protein